MSRLLFVGSSGGHLAQLLTMRDWWENHEREWVTFRTPDAESALRQEVVTWAYFPTTRSVKNTLRNGVLANRVIRRFRPEVVISTGAAVAVPFFSVARIRSIPTIFIEVYDRIDSRTLTGTLCRPISSMYCVQWEDQRQLYPGSHVIGPLL